MKKSPIYIFLSIFILKAIRFPTFFLFFFLIIFIYQPIFAQKKKAGEPSERWKTAQPPRERIPPNFYLEIDNRYDRLAKKRKKVKKIQQKYSDSQKQREIGEEILIETTDRHKKDARKKKTPPSDIENDYLKLKKEEVQRSAEEWEIYRKYQEVMQKSWYDFVRSEFRRTQITTPLEYDAGRASIAETARYEGEYVIDLNKNRRMAFETASFGRDYVIKRRLQLIRRSSAFKIASSKKHHQPFQPLQVGIFFKTEKGSIKGKPNYQRKKVKFRYDKKEAEMWRQLEENQKNSSREPVNGGGGSGFGGDNNSSDTTIDSENATDLQEDTEESTNEQEGGTDDENTEDGNESTDDDGDGWNTESTEEDDGDGGGN